jgi:dipeptidyl aminopeptidase/acylaminoacyl peptidase
MRHILHKTSKSQKNQPLIVWIHGGAWQTGNKENPPLGLMPYGYALALLLGKPVEEVKDLATLASPVFQVDKDDPPLFIVHGEQDIQVPINQSIELWTTYQAKNGQVQIEFVPDAGHSSPAYMKKELLDKVAAFLKKYL